MITKLILLCSTLQIGFTYFTNVLQQCGCSQISEISKSPFCTATSIKSCSNFNSTSECLSNYPGMECVWSNSTCSQFSSCSKLIVSDPTDCKKQLFGVCSYNSEALMNQDGTFNCTDTVYQKCANITADYLCVGAFETRYKMCDWQKNKCVTVDTEKCSSFPNQQSCKYFDCYWENNKCRQKKCDDIKTQSDCIKGVKTEFSEGYDICQWNDGLCSSLDDTNKLTSETCYTGSLYTFSWQERFKKCVKCTKISNVPVITRFWNATYCGLLYSTYSSSACLPKIRESYTLTVIINILIIYQNGTYFYTDDVTIYLVEKITIIYENNTIMFPNGTYCFDNGTLYVDGALTDNACVTDLDIHLTGYFGSTGPITNYPEKVVRVIQSERVLIIFKSGTYIQISKTILKIYMSMHVTIILPDKSYKVPNGDWCYNNLTLVYANGTMEPNGCLEKPVEQAYLGYYEDNSYVTFPYTIPNPYLVEIVEIFIVIYLNGTKITASNIFIFVNVTIIFQNNTVILPDSSFCFVNGTRRHSDGTLEDGICPTNIDVYSYGYFNETKYYDFSGNEKDILEYKPTVVEETLDITIIFLNGTYVSTQNVVEVQLYVDLEVTIIYPNETARYPNKTVCDSSGTVIQPDGTRYENACWRKKDTYYRGYYSSSGNYVTYSKPVPNPSNYQTTVIFSNGTKVYTTNATEYKNVTLYQNITIIFKNSTVIQPNGTINYYNGTVKEKDGTIYQTNTYVDRSTYYQGYYSSSGTYVQYQSTYTYSYYYYGYTYYYYDYDYDYQYYDPQDTYYSSNTQSTSTTNNQVNITYVNENIEYSNITQIPEVYTQQYCRCSKFWFDDCEQVGYCKWINGVCVEKECDDFNEDQCNQYQLLSGCEWKTNVCQSYSGCTGKPVTYLSDCIKMGRYSCTISSYGDLKQTSKNYYCQNFQITNYCYQYSQYDCYNYAIARSERCIWLSGTCQKQKIECDWYLPRDVCQLFDCYYDVDSGGCRYKACTDIKEEKKCNIIKNGNDYHAICQWYKGHCFNANDTYYLDQTTCAKLTYGTYYFDGLQCFKCQQYTTSGFIVPLAILLLQLTI